MHKTSRQNLKTHAIEYRLRTEKTTMEPNNSQLIMKDPLSHHVDLSRIIDTPSAYYRNYQRIPGYPLPQEFHEVQQLEWIMEDSNRFRFPRQHFIGQRDGGVFFRDDLLHLPETTVAWHQDYTYGALMPLVDTVKGQTLVFSASMDGKLSAFQAVTGKTEWEHDFPLGEVVEQAMASFLVRDELLLAVGTSQGKIYFFSAEKGFKISEISLGRAISAPLYFLKHEKQLKIIAVNPHELVCINPENNSIVWRKNLSEVIVHSPLSIQVGSEHLIFTASQRGNIQARKLNGELAWQRSMQTGLPYGIQGFLYHGLPYLAGATANSDVVLMSGVNGGILSRITLPGPPRSFLSIDPESMSFGLVCADTEKVENSYFFNQHFFNEDRIPGKIALQGKTFLGPMGVRVDGESFYYLVDDQWRLWMLQKGSSRPLRGYPFKLAFTEGSNYPHLSGGMVLVEHALFLACPGKALFAVGLPKKHVMDASFRIPDTFHQTKSNYRFDLDSLPQASVSNTWQVPLLPADNRRPLPEPLSFFHPDTRQTYIVLGTAHGELSFYKPGGEHAFSLPLKTGKIYASPIFDYQKAQEITIYILSDSKLQAWKWNSITQELKLLWERKDLSSRGSSFMLTEQKTGQSLIFVDESKFLTAVCAKTGETIFREWADAFQFAYYVIYSVPLIFCGSKKIHAHTGKVLGRAFTPGAHSSLVGFSGKVMLLQADSMNMKAWDAHTLEHLWNVRRLWCRKYCFQNTAPAIMYKGYQALIYWADYNRLLCIDAGTGFIRWRASLREDYLLSSPVLVEDLRQSVVYIGSIYGILYAFDARSGMSLDAFPLILPGRTSEREELKGCSSPLVVNGMLLIYQMEYGLIQVGNIRENNRDLEDLSFEVLPHMNDKKKIIFNRAQLLWGNARFFSNIVKN